MSAMSEHAVTSPLVPRPLCAAYAPSLRLLGSGGLDPDERAAVEAHLAACAWCQQQLATYDVVEEALRRHYATDSAKDALIPPAGDALPSGRAPARGRPAAALGDAMSISAGADDDEDEREGLARSSAFTLSTDAPSARWRTLHEPYPSLTPLARIAFVLVLGMFAVALLARLGGIHMAGQGAAPAPVTSRLPSGGGRPFAPPLDARAQTYVSLLRAYYQPLYTELSSSHTCEVAVALAAPDDQLNILLGCRDAAAAVVSAAQTLSRHLAAAAPPARWQDAHVALARAVQVTIAAYQQRVAAIDAESVTRFDAAAAQTYDALLMRYCDPITLINTELPAGLALDTPSAMCAAPPADHRQPYATIHDFNGGSAGTRRQAIGR